MVKSSGSALVLALLLAVLPTFAFLGCEEDSTTEEEPTTVSFSDLSEEEQQEFAESVADLGVASVMNAKTVALDMLSGDFEGIGDFGTLTFSKMSNLSKSATEIASPPDTSWIGPDADGWYSYTYNDTVFGGGFTYRIRWTPDIWDDSNEGEEVTKVEIEFEYSISGNDFGGFEITTSLTQSIDESRSHVSGSMGYEFFVEEFEGVDATTDYNSTWTNVAIDSNDYSGDYTAEMSVDYTEYDEETMQLVQEAISFSSEFSFASDGSGTGSSSIGNLEVIRYVFDPIVSGVSWAGVYQLVTEAFAIDHPFEVSL